MPDVSNRVPENKAGPYYVTDECIGCGVCIDTAGSNFKMNDSDSNAYVYKQPASVAEKAACEEAREGCPADAIGNNG